MTTEELLAQLQGIRAPGEASWYPLAPGWWGLIIMVVLLPSAYWLIRRHRRPLEFYKASRQELDNICRKAELDINQAEFLQALSRWLRRVSLRAFPDQNISGLTGKRWLIFLDSIMQNNEFEKGSGRVFADQVYSADPEFQSDEIVLLCSRWLDGLKLKLQLPRSDKP